MRAVPTIGATAVRTPRTCSAAMSRSPAASRLKAYETGGASTATSAAIRTSINVSASRLDASIESAVMLARRSRTGVSMVCSGMGSPCRKNVEGRRCALHRLKDLLLLGVELRLGKHARVEQLL